MNKKSLIILLLPAITVLGIFIFIFNNQGPTIDGEGPKNEYYIEKGLEKVSSVLKSAVENYVKYNKSESTQDRKTRLTHIFSKDSPVLDRESAINTNGSINRVDATVTSLSSCKYPMSDYQCIKAMTNTRFYGVNTNYDEVQTYWVSITEEGKSIKVFDIGVEK